jgi:predicted TIM-barrel fold metal-dependent hydrolase
LTHGALVETLQELALLDHHVHGAISVPLDRDEFEHVITESDRPRRAGCSNFDTQIGLAIRKWCAPALGLEAFVSPDEYVARRLELGPRAVNEALLRGAHLGGLLIDTGFATGTLLDVNQMADVSRAPAWEIVRLEAVAERVITHCNASTFADHVRAALSEAAAAGAKGTKSIAAYRYGLDVPQARPSEAEVAAAAGTWLHEIDSTGQNRVSHPVLLSFLMWSAVDLALPLQFHVGYGDSDIRLLRANPALLTDFMVATQESGCDVMLLHCYPYHREAAYLAQMFPHVFFDIGEAINYSGLQSIQIVRESLEIAPFYKQLYSSDGWGPAELHFLGAQLWRNAMAEVLSQWVDRDECTLADARRFATLIGRDNAAAVYGVEPR